MKKYLLTSEGLTDFGDSVSDNKNPRKNNYKTNQSLGTLESKVADLNTTNVDSTEQLPSNTLKHSKEDSQSQIVKEVSQRLTEPEALEEEKEKEPSQAPPGILAKEWRKMWITY